MTGLTRRSALLAGTATLSLAACGQAKGKPAEAPAAAKPASAWIDGTEMARRIAAGETTALAETEAAIARANAVNGKINAIATDTFAQALIDAPLAKTGPMAGVPSLIKDLNEWKGAPTLFGSRAFRGNVATGDSPVGEAWRKAGIVCIGKSTSPEMGLISSTEPLVTGATRNPWDTSRIPGGSSGGAAALVAARVVPFAHASDGGGSIRIPASTCGVFGLKPSRGRLVSRDTAAAADAPPVDISVSNCVSISVRDSITMFRAAQTLNGTHPELGEIKPLDRKLRIGYAPLPLSGSPVAPETAAAIDDVAKFCAGLGHTVDALTMKIDGVKFIDRFLLYWASGAAQFAQAASAYSGKPIGPDILEPWTLALVGRFMARQSEFAETVAYLKAFEAEYNKAIEGFDVILSPVTGSPAVPIGEQAPDGDPEKVLASVLNFAAFTAPMNVAGAASMSVPLAWSPSGLPIGAMFSGRNGEDGLLFELALQLEAARPWADKRPPVSAF